MSDYIPEKTVTTFEPKAELYLKTDGTIGIGLSLKYSIEKTSENNSFWGIPDWMRFPNTNKIKERKLFLENFELAAKNAARAYQIPDVTPFKLSKYFYDGTLQEEAVVTAIISGKGGVGKTSVALGLAEYFAENNRGEKILIVDFDLHNRGLTSKYGAMHKETVSILSLMKRFSEQILKGEALKGTTDSNQKLDMNYDTFMNLRDIFCYEENTLRDFLVENLYGKEFNNSENEEISRIAQKCYFLPSRKAGEVFLGTEESRYDFADVAIFIKFLACFAKKSGYSKVILDCHGAHDLFMVGAIIACNEFVIVTKADPMAFEGTIELIKFTEELIEKRRPAGQKRILVFNEYRDSDKEIARILYEAFYEHINTKVPFEKLPKIYSSNEIQDMLIEYCKPCILDFQGIGEAIEIIGKSLD